MTNKADAFSRAVAAILLARLKEKERGRTWLARQVGMSRNSAYLYLDGTRAIPIDTLRIICAVLDLKITTVVRDAEREIEKGN